jgi:pimeloyl-ACP methyl ester carboxylesterase
MGAVELSCRDWGDGHHSLTVVLIHCLSAQGQIWDPLARGLSDVYRLVAPDLRGHGASPRPGSYRPEEYLDDIEALIARRGMTSLALIGHSFGGMIAAGFAIRHPEQVRVLVTIDINIPPPVRLIERVRAAGARPHPVFATRDEGVSALRRALAPRASEEMVGVLADALLTTSEDGLTFDFDRNVLRQFEPLEFAEQIDRILCPTLFLRGSESSITDRGGAIAMLSRLEHARLVEIPRAGHHVFLDNPSATIQEIRQFLAETLGRSPTVPPHPAQA